MSDIVQEKPLVAMIEDMDKRTVLSEPEIAQYDFYFQTTQGINVSSQNTYMIENRNAGSEMVFVPEETFLMVQWQLTQSNGDTIVLTTSSPAYTYYAGLATNAWSLFTNVRFEIAGTEVDSNKEPGQTYNILTKASKTVSYIYGNSYDMQYYPAGMPYYGESGTNATTSDDSNFQRGNGAVVNSGGIVAGQTSALAISAGGGYIWTKLRLKDILGIFNSGKVFPCTDWVLRMDKNINYSQFILTDGVVAGDTSLATNIQSIYLYSPQLRAKDPFASQKFSMTMLRDHPIPIDWMKISYFRTDYVAGATSVIGAPIFTGLRQPRYLFCAFQPTSFITTLNAGNPGAYQSPNITQCYVMYNGQQYPFQRYDGSSTNFVREVEMLLSAYGNNASDHASMIFNSTNFGNYHCIYYFDISHTTSVTEENAANNNIVMLYVQNGSNDSLTAHCIVLGECHNKLSLMGSVMSVSSMV